MDYLRSFPFIDLIIPVHPADERVSELDAGLVAMLPRAGSDVGVVAPAEQPGDSAEYTYRIRRIGRRGWRELDSLSVRMAAHETTDPLSVPVRAYDADGNPVGPNRVLRDFLSVEIELPELGSFVLVEGRWFRVNRDRLAELDRRLSAISEFGHSRLDLPDWYHRDDERRYNEYAAAQMNWRLMDRHNYRGADRRRDQIEVCDLLTPSADLVCVKKLHSSTALSHLFSQGSVSATLYRDDRNYRAFVHREYREHWQHGRWSRPTVVYAIGTERTGPLHKCLPFFSRINLGNHVTTITRTDLDVALARILVTRFRQQSQVPVPEPRPSRVGQLDLFES